MHVIFVLYRKIGIVPDFDTILKRPEYDENMTWI